MASGTWGTGGTDSHPLNVRIAFQLGTSQCQTGFKLRKEGLNTVDVQEAATEVADWVNTSFRTIFVAQDRFLGVDVVDMTTGDGGAVSFSNLMGSMPSQPGERLPSYVQVPVSLKGSLRRRYGQGRMLWPVRYEGWVDEDVLNSTGAAALQAVITNLSGRFIGSSRSSDYRMINAHGVIAPKAATPTTPARPEVPPMWHDVTTARLATVMSFLRSRKAGVGS